MICRSRARPRIHSFSTLSTAAPHAAGDFGERQPFQVAQHEHLAVVVGQLAQGVGQQHGLFAAARPAGSATTAATPGRGRAGPRTGRGRPRSRVPGARRGPWRRGSGATGRPGWPPGSAAARRPTRPRSCRGSGRNCGAPPGTFPEQGRTHRPCPGGAGRSARGPAGQGIAGTVPAAAPSVAASPAFASRNRFSGSVGHVREPRTSLLPYQSRRGRGAAARAGDFSPASLPNQPRVHERGGSRRTSRFALGAGKWF